MGKPKILNLEHDGQNKLFMEVQMDGDTIVGMGKPFKIHGACRLESPDKVELVIEEVD